MLVGPIYLDASAWAKPYLNEPGAAELDKALAGRRDLMVSDLGLTELIFAFCRRSRSMHHRAAALRLQATLLHEIQHGELAVISMTREVHRSAERLLLGTTSGLNLRAADALHLALALEGGAMTLACYDQRLRTAAIEQGMRLLPE